MALADSYETLPRVGAYGSTHAQAIKRGVLAMYMAHPFPQWSSEERARRLAFEICRYKFLGLDTVLPGARLIEVGCGTGMRTMGAARHFGVREFVGFDHSLTRAARSLGAPPATVFFRVVLPLILPGVIAGALFAFVTSFDEVVVASFINGDTTTFPLYLLSQLRFPTLLPQVIAVACIVMAASVLLLIGAEIGRRIVERRLGTEL